MLLVIEGSQVLLVVALGIIVALYYLVLSHSASVSGRPWGWFATGGQSSEADSDQAAQEPPEAVEGDDTASPRTPYVGSTATGRKMVPSSDLRAVNRWESEGGAITSTLR